MRTRTTTTQPFLSCFRLVLIVVPIVLQYGYNSENTTPHQSTGCWFPIPTTVAAFSVSSNYYAFNTRTLNFETNNNIKRRIHSTTTASSSSSRHFQHSLSSSSSRGIGSALSATGVSSPPSSSSSSSPQPPSKGDFEYEELKAQMMAMKKQELSSDDLTMEKRQELQDYVMAIIQKRQPPNFSIPLTDMGLYLPGSTWRLSYSTEGFAGSASGLPRDATLYVEFDETNDSAAAAGVVDEATTTPTARKAIYRLQFGRKTLGLRSLQANCEWTVGTDETAIDPTKAGVVSLKYQTVTTNVFGFRNVGVGFFGLLQGRSNYIQSVYFDNTLWIEQGVNPQGVSFYNVYTRNDDDDDEEEQY